MPACGSKFLTALLLAGLSFSTSELRAEDGPARRPMPMISPTVFPTSTPIPVVKPEELAKAEAALRAEIAQSAAQLKALDTKVADLGKVQAAQVTLQDKQGLDIQACAEGLQALGKKMEDSLKKVDEVRASLEKKGERMESLLDLMNTLKRDINDNAHEIAEIKDSLSKLQSREKAGAEPGTWDQIVSWRYMPATAAVLGAVALGWVAAKK